MEASEAKARAARESARPSYLAYVTSFAAIGIYWMNHHYVYQGGDQRRLGSGSAPR